jgi:hypothetical protein
VTFDLYSFRFNFSALHPINFPGDIPGNILRGALGITLRRIACIPECPALAGRDVRKCEFRESCAYARIFEPAAVHAGPSGLSDWPRPFVLRAGHLKRQSIASGERFFFDVNVFDTRNPFVDYFERSFRELGRDGMGPDRGHAELISVEQLDCKGSRTTGSPISIALDPGPSETERIRVAFRTPTELKSDEVSVRQPEFAILFSRARDRVSTLRSLYGGGPLEIDFRALGQRARDVRMTACHIRQFAARRRSTRTGLSHDIGGFIGQVEYEGDLREFLPILLAAQWTGVGRHCVWGNGELRVETIDAL